MQFLGPPLRPQSRRIVMEITSTCNIVMLLYAVREVLFETAITIRIKASLRGQLRRNERSSFNA